MRNEVNSTDAELDLLQNCLSREQFFREREEYLAITRAKTEIQLRELGYENEVVADMATIIMRCQYVYNVVSKHTNLLDKVEVDLSWQKDLHKNEGGVTGFDFIIGGRIADNIQTAYEAAKQGTCDIKLSDIRIGMNINEVHRQVRNHNNLMNTYEELYPDKVEERKSLSDESINERSIEVEKDVVEEISHALYWAAVINDPPELLLALEDMIGYDSRVPSDCKLLPQHSPEEEEMLERNYYNKKVEIAGASFVRSFCKKYYQSE